MLLPLILSRGLEVLITDGNQINEQITTGKAEQVNKQLMAKCLCRFSSSCMKNLHLFFWG